MRSDIRTFVQKCIKCQQAKFIRHNRAPLHSFKAPKKRFLHIYVDIVGPLTVSHGYSYLLSIICHFTRHVELVPLRDVTATEYAKAFLLHWVGRFGCPTQMTADRGRQFTSYLWKEMSEFLGTKLSYTTEYHPEASGMVERVHRTVKTTLKYNDNPSAWYENPASFYLVSAPWLRRILAAALLSLALAPPCACQDNFFQTMATRFRTQNIVDDL